MFADEERQSSDGVAMNATESRRLAGADPFVQMLQDRENLLVGQLGPVKRSSLMFGEPRLAGLASQEADVEVFSHEFVDAEVAAIADAVEFARAVLTAEPREILSGHGTSITKRRGRSVRLSIRDTTMLRQSARLK